MSVDVTGVDTGRVTAWLAERVELVTPLAFELVAHGRSNLTYVVTDSSGSRWVLRRPPMGQVLASAHDMGREHRIIAALQGSGVPVPGVVGMCTDESVNGAPFYVMEHVDGSILKNIGDTADFTAAQRRTMSESLVDTLAVLHDVDPDGVGLGELGKKSDYLARQLRRWTRQIEQGSNRDLPLFDDLARRLNDAMPAQQGAGIVHGDYRLDNCMIGPDHTVAAVLDWELCTLGDVLADLGGMLMWWGDPTSSTNPMTDVPTLAEGFLSSDEVVSRYEALTHRDLAALPYYVSFQYLALGRDHGGRSGQVLPGSHGRQGHRR